MFNGRHFDRSILLCVRWYLAYNLSLRDLEETMAERGNHVDHHPSSPGRSFRAAAARTLQPEAPRVTGKWPVDETYVRVRSRWKYLYRAVESEGRG